MPPLTVLASQLCLWSIEVLSFQSLFDDSSELDVLYPHSCSNKVRVESSSWGLAQATQYTASAEVAGVVSAQVVVVSSAVFVLVLRDCSLCSTAASSLAQTVISLHS